MTPVEQATEAIRVAVEACDAAKHAANAADRLLLSLGEEQAREVLIGLAPKAVWAAYADAGRTRDVMLDLHRDVLDAQTEQTKSDANQETQP